MKKALLFVLFAIGVGSAIASDPPGYARALIGRVTKIVPEGIVVQGVGQNQIHPQPAPGVDHECFAGVGGPSLVRGLRAQYRVGDKIEIMVTLTDDTYLLTLDPSHQTQIEICNMLSESLAFPVGVDWSPTDAAAKPAAVAPALAPASAPPSVQPATPLPDLSAGSINDPIPGAHK